MRNDRGQVTIFVIAGILLVGIIGFFVLFNQEKEVNLIGGKTESNLRGVLESCLEEKIRGTVKVLMENGGYLENPLNISFEFEDSDRVLNVSYLCYTSQEYVSCTNQEPILLKHITEEIETGISPQVKQCFDDVAKTIGNKEENVEAKYNGFNVEIVPRKIVVNVDGEITSTKSGQTTIWKEFTGDFPSRLYEITNVVQEITNNEADYCHFELIDFMMFYPEFEIDKALTRDSTSIYTVKHKKGVEEFIFAVRSCSFPPGF